MTRGRDSKEKKVEVNWKGKLLKTVKIPWRTDTDLDKTGGKTKVEEEDRRQKEERFSYILVHEECRDHCLILAHIYFKLSLPTY